jgi:hypothetical protein
MNYDDEEILNWLYNAAYVTNWWVTENWDRWRFSPKVRGLWGESPSIPVLRYPPVGDIGCVVEPVENFFISDVSKDPNELNPIERFSLADLAAAVNKEYDDEECLGLVFLDLFLGLFRGLWGESPSIPVLRYPPVGDVEWRFSDVSKDPNELNPIERFSLADLAAAVNKE